MIEFISAAGAHEPLEIMRPVPEGLAEHAEGDKAGRHVDLADRRVEELPARRAPHVRQARVCEE